VVVEIATGESLMEIERGMQPNCSELVIRLHTHKREEALEKLRGCGIDEYLVRDRYAYGQEEQTNWDDEANLAKVVSVKEIPKKVLKAYELWNKGGTGSKWVEAEKTLKDWGFDMSKDSIVLMDKEAGSKDAWLTNYPYSEDSELCVMYHQHCTTQGFPMLKKISEHVGSDVEAHDGGSIHYYEAFLEGRDPFEDEE
jgi:hypothetical protein